MDEILDTHHPFGSTKRRSPVDPFEQHRQLSTSQRDCTTRSLGLHETSSFEPLLEQAESIAVEPKQLHHVATPPAKDEEMTGVGLLFKRRLDLGRKPLKAATHVRHTCRNPDPRARALLLHEKVDHPRKTSSTARITAGSA
jgi:hypothetical protein